MGVVYGDIGTSPLYALRECFHGSHGLAVTDDNILGVLSLIVWSLILIVSLKYLVYFLRADNNGEGGVLALLALTHPTPKHGHSKNLVVLIGLFGAALLFGDGVITPSISVLSAVEGLTVAAPVFKPYVVPAAIAILCVLFLPQRYGTQVIGAAFGPIIILWFLALAVMGIAPLIENPSVIRALNPYYAWHYFQENGWYAFVSLGTVFLVVTGCEAMYADMGHFGKTPIRVGWFTFVFPCLLLNYFGQGAFLLQHHEAADNPFFKMVPTWAIYPLVILASMAAVIASQALITGVFSLTRQAIQLGYLPRLAIHHTSEDEIGQIYVPSVNWALLVSTVWLVASFQTSSNLAAAYGIAVSGTMVISTILLYFVAVQKWHWPKWSAWIFIASLLMIDLSFFGSNALKIAQGGWFPLLSGAVLFTIMTTWRRGRVLLGQRLKETAVPVKDFIESAQSLPRVPGTALYMTSISNDTPAALVHNTRHNKVIHERVIFMTVETQDVPHVPREERYVLTHLDDHFYRINVSYGFMDSPNVPAVLTRCTAAELDLKLSEITYFMGRETLLATGRPGMAIWRERLFSFMSRNAQRATAFFKIPAQQVMEIGMQVEL